MFGFMESDWFTITLEIVFLIFIIYDTKRYFETRKREYLINIVLTIGFFIWAIVPFYNKYLSWNEADQAQLIRQCETREHNSTLCECLEDKIFKAYGQADYEGIDTKHDADYLEFKAQSIKECKGEDDSWF